MGEQSKSRLFRVEVRTIVVLPEPVALSAAHILKPGALVDKKYQVLALLGEGGMGAVYRAHHLMLDKDVALKTYRASDLSREACLRFQREAQAIARLNHKNIIQVFDFGLSEEGWPYYTMEYLRGQSLAQRLECQDLDGSSVLPLFVQACEGLAVCHSKGIIHRDIKPSNIFIEESQGPDLVKLVDFGIASLTAGFDGQQLTAVGTVFGSPLYMSPEQAMGLEIGEASDIYSLGCALFEALTGKPPYLGSNALETIMLHQSAAIPSLKESGAGRYLPDRLDGLVTRMLAKSPADRPRHMVEVAEELRLVMQNRETGRERFTPAPPIDEPEDSSVCESEQAAASKPLLVVLIAGAVFLGAFFVLYFMASKAVNFGAAGVPNTKLVLSPAKFDAGPFIESKTKDGKDAAKLEDTLFETSDKSSSLLRAGKFAEAEPLLVKKLANLEATADPKPRKIADLFVKIAECEFFQGKFAQSAAHSRRANAIYEKVLAEDDPRIGDSLFLLGQACQKNKQFAQAVDAYERALQNFKTSKISTDPEVADTLFHLAICYESLGNQSKANANSVRALAVLEQIPLKPGEMRFTVRQYLRDKLKARRFQ